MTQSITLSDNKKKSQEKIPDSFSRSVGTANVKRVTSKNCLYLYFNLFDNSKVSLFSYFGASQWLQDAHKVSELFIVWDIPEIIISNLSEKWSEPDGISNRLKLVCLTLNRLEKARRPFHFLNQSINYRIIISFPSPAAYLIS